ncbi:DUF3016 domain-containing protein [Pseudomonas sp. zfem002]|uniref:DUF3016 domain-containing protein n=1 Tax=Pseudomonas sp. zfem002 TaxID=3078197 RepID=UPI0029275ABD|nr:DUF3016 domain-containing protein [Pseudomonas sp. zfem002]MDU9393517.1 DUF3016 domain-containing protein [Pseudomonas sp. zfem002]
MRSILTLATLCLLASTSMAQAATTNVQVNFIHPEKFRDASLRGDGYQRGADEQVMKQLRVYLETLGNRYLGTGQSLRVDIRDIDLAGHYEPWQRNASSVRFMRDITWPSIDLHYSLQEHGQVVKQADTRVDDKFYLQRPGRLGNSDSLWSEKAMLNDWFRDLMKQ